MALIDEYVKINITRATMGLEPISLDTLLIIGSAKKTANVVADETIRVKEYGSLLEVTGDFAADTKEYKAASLYFGQEIRPTKLLIGQVFKDETFEQAYPKILLKKSNFYGVMITSVDSVDILAIAAAVQADNYRIFGTSSSDVKTYVQDDQSHIIYKLKALNYDRTFTIFNTGANTSYPEAAWFGLMLTKNAGSATWAYKTLTNVVADNLTSSQRSVISGNKGNYYVNFGGKDIMLDGITAQGEYIDIMIGIDWITSQMKLSLANALVTSNKIPFTNQGIGIVESIVRNTLNDAADKSILDRDSIKVSVPDVRDILVSDRINRTLPDVKFEARLAGAMHKIGISGILTV